MRTCEYCDTPLRMTQKRFCSRRCVSRYMRDRKKEVRRTQLASLFGQKMAGRGWLSTSDIAAAVGRETAHQVRDTLDEMKRYGMVESKVMFDPEDCAKRRFWRYVLADDRVCAHEGCDTRLSKYNPDRYCAAHAPLHTDEVGYAEVLASLGMM